MRGTLAPGDVRGPSSRRRFLRYALGGVVAVAAAGAAGFELVDHGVLPGKSELDQLDGACDVSFAAGDAVTHAAALAGVPVRVASGYDDPFYPGVRTLARALPRNPGGVRAEVYFGSGCHTGAFFNAQEPPSLAFLARHLG